MHIYGEHFELAKKILEVPVDKIHMMPSMPVKAREKFEILLENEKKYRQNIDTKIHEFTDDYFKDLDIILRFLFYKKQGKKELQEEIRRKIKENYIGVIRG